MQALVTLCMSDIGRLLGTLGLLSLGITMTLWGLKHRWYRPHPLWIWGLGSLLLVILLWIPQLVTAEDSVEVLTVRYQDEGTIALVAGGVGMRYPTGWPSNPTPGPHRGDIILDVPGTVRQAYLYWGGYDDEQVGDDTVSLTVDGVTTTITADYTYGPASWSSYYRYVYVEDVTSLVQAGTHTYTVSDFDEMYSRDGAGLMVVYEDPSLPWNRVEIRDGLDRFYRWWYNPPDEPRAETAITCFDFEPSLVDRLMDITMFVAGVDISGQYGERPTALWYRTGTDVGTMPTDIIFEEFEGDEDHDPQAEELQGPPDYPFGSLDGSEWDTYTNSIPILAGDTWACIQVESADYLDYRPASGVGIAFGASFRVAQPEETPTPTATSTGTATPTATSTGTAPTATPTGTTTPTATSTGTTPTATSTGTTTPTSKPPGSEPPTSTPTPTPTPPAPMTPTPTEVLIVRLPETGGLPGWFTVVLGVPILIGAAGLLHLALLEKRGRRGDGKGH